MNERWTLVLVAVALLLALLRTAGDLGFWRRYLAAVTEGVPAVPAGLIYPRVTLKGNGAAATPRKSALEAGFAPEAITTALTQARQQNARVLLVQRGGHRVAEYFDGKTNARSEIAGGDLSPLLLALAQGALVEDGKLDPTDALQRLRSLPKATPAHWRNPWSADAASIFSPVQSTSLLAKPTDGIAKFMSLRVWQRLNASDAWLWGTDVAPRLDCCVVARVDDWLRLAEVILHDGKADGDPIASPEWMHRLLIRDVHANLHPIWLAAAPISTGDEPPAAREVMVLDLGPYARLWLVPRRQLLIFYWAHANSVTATDTTVANTLIRGLLDQAPPTQSDLHDLVPGH
jgi:hypothetical protein